MAFTHMWKQSMRDSGRRASAGCNKNVLACPARQCAARQCQRLLTPILPRHGVHYRKPTHGFAGISGAAPDSISNLGTSAEDALELAATKKNLREALQKVDLLTQQVAIVEELQVRMVEQDQLIGELERLVERDRAKQDDERSTFKVQLAAAQDRLSATSRELEEARATLDAMPDVAKLQEEVARLGKLEAKLEEAQSQLARLAELDVLQTRVQDLEALLEQEQTATKQLAADLAAAREQLAASQGAAAAAKQEAQDAQSALARKVDELAAIEADVENMRKMMSKGGRKNRGKVPPAKAAKGFAQPAAAAAVPAAAVKSAQADTSLTAGAENHLRQELKQAQNELEQLQGTLEEREAQLQAAQSAVEFLSSQCKEQELHVTALEEQLVSSTASLEARLRAEAAERQAALEQQLESLNVKLRAEANDKASAMAALRAELEAVTTEREALAEESARLQAAIGELEDRRRLQDAAVGELDVSLQDLREEVETAQQLKLDLAILAEAFGAKEIELEATQAELAEAEAKEAALRQQVREAETSMAGLQTALSELSFTNSDLTRRMDELAASITARREEAAAAQARAKEAEAALAGARSELTGLRGELGVKKQALADAQRQLTGSRSAEASQRMAAEALSERLAAEQAAVIKQSRDVEALREQVEVLNEQISFLTGSESAVRKLQDALRRSDEELAGARGVAEQAEARAEAAEEGRRGAEGAAASAQEEAARLRRELSSASAALAEREASLAAARRGAEATEAELRAAKRAAEAATGEAATMRTQVQLLSGELTAVRQERDAASRAEFESLRQLQGELAAEAEATLELLNKAEALVLSASEEASSSRMTDVNNILQHARNDLDVQTELWESERQRSAALEREVSSLQEQLRNAALGRRAGGGSGALPGATGGSSMTGTLAAAFNASVSRSGSPGLGGAAGRREREALELANAALFEELNAAKDGALAAKAEAEALQTRVSFLERELRSRDALITELRSSSVGGGAAGRGGRGAQGETLVAQLKALQEENTKLKQSAARQQQLLNQTKRFFEKKMGPGGGDLAALATRSSSADRNGV